MVIHVTRRENFNIAPKKYREEWSVVKNED